MWIARMTESKTSTEKLSYTQKDRSKCFRTVVKYVKHIHLKTVSSHDCTHSGQICRIKTVDSVVCHLNTEDMQVLLSFKLARTEFDLK